MSYDAWPTGGNLTDFFTAAGLTVTSAQEDSFDAPVSAAIRAFERATGRVPFLAGDAALKTFDFPTNRSGILEIPDLAASPSLVSYVPSTGDPVTYVLNTDYWLLPSTRATDEPITALRLLRGGEWQTLQITGRWGYATTVPEDAWYAVLARAAWVMTGTMLLGAQGAGVGGVKSWTAAGVTMVFESGFDLLRETWGGKDGSGGLWGEAVAMYRRLTF